ncbi:MAG TPA: hypothetical protein VGE52_19430 [Pirellulales bacterium]
MAFSGADAPQLKLSPRFLFHVAAPCHQAEGVTGPVTLDEKYRLPDLATIEGVASFADVRVAWSEAGIAASVRATGKERTPRCREQQLAESDGLHLWLNLRPGRDVHRATRFCTHFVFLPAGAGRQGDQPVVGQLLINRAKEQAPLVVSDELQVKSKLTRDGYQLDVFIAGRALSGYAPADNPQLGLTYLIRDQELGDQTWNVDSTFPFAEDPSLWGLLDLVK